MTQTAHADRQRRRDELTAEIVERVRSSLEPCPGAVTVRAITATDRVARAGDSNAIPPGASCNRPNGEGASRGCKNVVAELR
jgi:hypothetical protein